MKKIIFILPICSMFAFCSSSRKPVNTAGPGISNVTVNSNGQTPLAGSSSSAMATTTTTTTPATTGSRDWAYKATYDTAINGTWVLQGVAAADGNWSETSTWYANDTTGLILPAGPDSASLAFQAKMQTYQSLSATMTKGKKTKVKKNVAPATSNPQGAKATTTNDFAASLNDTTMASADNNIAVVMDSATLANSIKPFTYWKRIPQLNLNANNLVFSGNTGCNSVSGSFVFDNKDIEFKRINSSKMACNEYDESNYLTALKKVDNYIINGDVLELKQGSTLLLSFKRK